MSRGRLLYRRVLLDAEGRARGVWWIDAIAGRRMRVCRRHGDCTVCERPEPLDADVLRRRIAALHADAMRWCSANRGNAPVAEPVTDLRQCLHEAEADLARPYRVDPSPAEIESQVLGHRPSSGRRR